MASVDCVTSGDEGAMRQFATFRRMKTPARIALLFRATPDSADRINRGRLSSLEAGGICPLLFLFVASLIATLPRLRYFLCPVSGIFHSQSAQTAVTLRILRQILLVVGFRKIEIRHLGYFGGDLSRMTCPEQSRLVFGEALDRRQILLGHRGEDHRAVLGTHIVALSHALGRVM